MKLSEIKPNPDNPRVIRDNQFQKLRNSITEFPKMMELRPIVVDENNVVLGGNMRLRALQFLKMNEVPDTWVKKASELTDDEKRRFIIADNVSGGEWDWDLLANEWDAIQLDDWGIIMPTDFNTEINDINEVDEFNESINFTIKCESIEQLEKLQSKLNTQAQKINYDDFLIKSGL